MKTAAPAVSGAAVKPILKKTVATAASTSLPIARNGAEQRRLDSAIEQARRLQDEKDAARDNLAAIEELSDFPPSSKSDVVSKDDATRFLELVSKFHPSDYDALVEERNANERCGYALCVQSHVPFDHKLAVLRPSTRMPWCSSLCGKRALYVRAQLNETAAWERRGEKPVALFLRPDTHGDGAKLVRWMTSDTARIQSELAHERGESNFENTARTRLVSTDIVEQKVTGSIAQAPVFQDNGQDTIEGYRLTRTTYNVDDDTNTSKSTKRRDLNDILDAIRL